MERLPYKVIARNESAEDDDVITLAIRPRRTVSKRVTLSTLSEEGRHLSRVPSLPELPRNSLESDTIEDLDELFEKIDNKKKFLDEWQNSLQEVAVKVEVQERIRKMIEKITLLKNTIGQQIEAIVQIEPYRDSDGNYNLEGESAETIERVETLIEQINETGVRIQELNDKVSADFDEMFDQDIDSLLKGESFSQFSQKEVHKQLREFEKRASLLASQGRRRFKSDYSKHMPGQNRQLIESLANAQNEITTQADELRKKLKNKEPVTTPEIDLIETELRMMEKTVGMLPSEEQMYDKEDFERPVDLTTKQKDELQRLFIDVEKIPLSISEVVSYETSAGVQDDYGELLELTEELQAEIARMLNVGVAYSRDWRALDEIQEDISLVKERIEKTLSREESEISSPREHGNPSATPLDQSSDSEDGKAASRRFVAIKLPNGKVMMSHQNPEDLFPPGKDTVEKEDVLVESPDKKLLNEYKIRIEAVEERKAFFDSVKIEAQLSNNDKTNFNNIDTVLKELKKFFEDAEALVLEGKEIDSTLKKELSGHTEWLENAVAYYQDKLDKNEPPFSKETKENQEAEGSKSEESAGSVESPEAKLLHEYKGIVDEAKVDVAFIKSHIIEEQLTSDYESNLNFLYTNLETAEERYRNMEASVLGAKEIDVDTKNSFLESTQLLKKIITYYKERIEAGEPPFSKEAVKGVTREGDAAPDAKAEPATEKKEPTPEYVKLRKEWIKAKKVHDEAQAEYKESLEKFYGSFWNRTRTAFGFKPDLSPEVLAIRDKMFAATAKYNETSKKVADEKKKQRPVAKEVLDRHKRLLAHSLVLRTFNDQLGIQKKAAETKYPRVREFFATYGKQLRLGAAFTMGLATGGIGTATWFAGRSLAGAYVTGAATSFVGAIQDKKVAAAKETFAADYTKEAEQLIETLQKKETLSEKQLATIYRKLDEISGKVDEATQKRIRVVLLTALGTGIAFGATSGMVANFFDGDVSVPDTEGNGRAGAGTELADADSSKDNVGGSPENDTTYTAEKGDNFWNIMEGETEAGKLDYLDSIDEVHKQQVIDLVRDKIDADATLREELGFGKTADDLDIGAEVDTEKLNQLAEEIAKEKGWLKAEGATDVSASQNSEVPAENVTGTVEGTATEIPSTPVPTALEENESIGIWERGALAAAGLGALAVSEQKNSGYNAPQLKSVKPQNNIEFARRYIGGYTKFQADLQKQFIEKIQGPAPVDSLLGRIFGGPPNSADAYKIFGPYSIAEFQSLEKVNQTDLANALAKEQIDMKDYIAWRDTLKQWQKDGMVINPKDRFSDVVETAFINSLNQPKTS